MSLNIAKVANRFSVLHPLPNDLQSLVDQIQQERAVLGPNAVVQVPVTAARLVAIWGGIWQAVTSLPPPKPHPGPAATPAAVPASPSASGPAPAPARPTGLHPGPAPGPHPAPIAIPSSDLSLTLMLLVIAHASREAQVILHLAAADISLWSVALHALVEICMDDQDCDDPTAVPTITPFRAANGCCGPLPHLHDKGIDLTTFDKLKPVSGQRRLFVNAGTVEAFLASGGASPPAAAPPAAPVATPPSP